MKMQKIGVLRRSTHVKAISYQGLGKTGVLRIRFDDGETLDFEGVSFRTYSELRAAKDVSAYYFDHTTADIRTNAFDLW
jgi:hypothetical protein